MGEGCLFVNWRIRERVADVGRRQPRTWQQVKREIVPQGARQRHCAGARGNWPNRVAVRSSRGQSARYWSRQSRKWALQYQMIVDWSSEGPHEDSAIMPCACPQSEEREKSSLSWCRQAPAMHTSRSEIPWPRQAAFFLKQDNIQPRLELC